jgi:D-alanine--poly(phosphoribitol) ligase subunit 1
VNLIQRIDHWATVAPEGIAHLSGDSALTYGELRGRSDALASYLTKRFSDDRRPIAVLGHREPEMLIAFLGAVKSGRPYVPIDIALPQRRIDQILASSNAALTVTPDEVRQFSTSETGTPRYPSKRTTHFTSCSQAAAPANPRA